MLQRNTVLHVYTGSITWSNPKACCVQERRPVWLDGSSQIEYERLPLFLIWQHTGGPGGGIVDR